MSYGGPAPLHSSFDPRVNYAALRKPADLASQCPFECSVAKRTHIDISQFATFVAGAHGDGDGDGEGYEYPPATPPVNPEWPLPAAGSVMVGRCPRSSVFCTVWRQ